jgi:hypothetical protein
MRTRRRAHDRFFRAPILKAAFRSSVERCLQAAGENSVVRASTPERAVYSTKNRRKAARLAESPASLQRLVQLIYE